MIFTNAINKMRRPVLLGAAGLLFSLIFSPGAIAESPKERLTLEIEQIERRIEEKEEDLQLKRREYIQVRTNLKEAARTGFLGFWRTEEEIQALLQAKDSMANVKKEYTQIRRNIRRLRTRLRETKREKALETRR